jgi:hypothetical protein
MTQKKERRFFAKKNTPTAPSLPKKTPFDIIRYSISEPIPIAIAGFGFGFNVLDPVPEVDVMAKRPQGLLNVGTLSARMAAHGGAAFLRS